METDGGWGGASSPAAFRAVAEVGHALDALAEANLWSLSDTEVLALREALEPLRSRLEARVLTVTREVDSRGAAVAAGAPSTAGWLKARLRLHPGAAKAEVELARVLGVDLACTGAALAAGELNQGQARVVAASMHALPRALAPALRREAEGYLLTHARQFDPAALNILGRHLAVVVDPEGGPALEREENEQADRQQFSLVRGPDRSGVPRGFFTAESSALIEAALGPVSKPRAQADGTPDPRSAAQRRAEGLLELLRLAIGSPQMPEDGGEPVTVLLTTPLAVLHGHDEKEPCGHACRAGMPGDLPGEAALGQPAPGDAALGHPVVPGAAHLEDGSPVSPEGARRMSCDAWLVAGILGSAGQILDIGRSSRLVPRPIRRALIARDGGCAFPGCGRPPRWCQAHHVWHWSKGGPTALSNLVLLCGAHHRVIHHHGWSVWIDQDTHRPRFRAPRWIDPDQRVRHAWRPPVLADHPLRT